MVKAIDSYILVTASASLLPPHPLRRPLVSNLNVPHFLLTWICIHICPCSFSIHLRHIIVIYITSWSSPSLKTCDVDDRDVDDLPCISEGIPQLLIDRWLPRLALHKTDKLVNLDNAKHKKHGLLVSSVLAVRRWLVINIRTVVQSEERRKQLIWIVCWNPVNCTEVHIMARFWLWRQTRSRDVASQIRVIVNDSWRRWHKTSGHRFVFLFNLSVMLLIKASFCRHWIW